MGNKELMELISSDLENDFIKHIKMIKIIQEINDKERIIGLSFTLY